MPRNFILMRELVYFSNLFRDRCGVRRPRPASPPFFKLDDFVKAVFIAKTRVLFYTRKN